MKPLRCSSQSHGMEALQRRWLFNWMQPWKEEVWGKVTGRCPGPTEVGQVLVHLLSVSCMQNLLKNISPLCSFVLLPLWQGDVAAARWASVVRLSWWVFQTELLLHAWFGRDKRPNAGSRLRRPVICKGDKGFGDNIWEAGLPLLYNNDDGKWVAGLESWGWVKEGFFYWGLVKEFLQYSSLDFQLYRQQESKHSILQQQAEEQVDTLRVREVQCTWACGWGRYHSRVQSRAVLAVWLSDKPPAPQ